MSCERQTELEKTDPHKILGIVAGADHDTLRKAYIAKARAYHPDKFADSDRKLDELFEPLVI